MSPVFVYIQPKFRVSPPSSLGKESLFSKHYTNREYLATRDYKVE